jgi:Flp pilus assembly CpaF family ATPase
MPVVAQLAFTIRKRPEVVFIRAAAEARENLRIVGGTGSGKTTLANAILAEPAFAGDRVVLIEDTAELQCSAADQIQMLTKRTEPAVTMTDLMRDTLRLRPDRIVIGEVRDGSALDLLKAWNTGHPGGLATLHANSAAEGLSRLEDLIGEVTQRIPHRAIGQAIDLVIHIACTPGGRRVSEIMRVTGWEEGGYVLQAA